MYTSNTICNAVEQGSQSEPSLRHIHTSLPSLPLPPLFSPYSHILPSAVRVAGPAAATGLLVTGARARVGHRRSGRGVGGVRRRAAEI